MAASYKYYEIRYIKRPGVYSIFIKRYKAQCAENALKRFIKNKKPLWRIMSMTENNYEIDIEYIIREIKGESRKCCGEG